MGNRRTFRPWLWNLLLAAITAMFTAVLAGIVVVEAAPVAKAVYALLAVGFAVLTVRVLGRRVVVGPDGIALHDLGRTLRIPWDTIADVSYQQAGERLVWPTWAPVLRLHRPLRDGGPTQLELELVRSVPSRTQRRTLAERTVTAIRQALAAR
ncbi:PH domain-containing protein [Micromonospora yasonensis]|uniref:PH domain-containing protein n=1 Tax=Micromonospora yasonensis TaxID=1128667 RepID=UPI002231BBF8|nr:PH domain-containing protein [Micromonospora yasonensis]MCW3839825.1 PH domain-containing protein [Micromonospora yasonensis]